MKIDELKKEIEYCKDCPMYEICKKYNLQSVFPFGLTKNTIFFVFINPPPKNLTAHKSWKYGRILFFGDLRFWKFLNEIGIVSEKVLNAIKKLGWVPEILDLLKREVENFKPKKIITFGTFTYKALTGKDIKLKEFPKKINKEFVSKNYIIPTYFPTGRGRYKESVELTKKDFRIYFVKFMEIKVYSR